MRTTWKVAGRDGVVYPVRSAPMYSAKDDEASMAFGNEIIASYDEYVKKMASESNISASRNRAVERAMRYDSWCYVRYESLPSHLADGTYAILNRVSVDNPNKADGEVLDAAIGLANDVAHIVVAKRNMMDEADARRRIIFDKDNPHFKYGVGADELYMADKASEARAKKDAEVDALHAATQSACPHMSEDGHCLIHVKGCPYFDHGLCDLCKGFKK